VGSSRDRSGETVETPSIDHAQSRLDARLRIDNSVSLFTRIGCSAQRYPNGIDATITPAGTHCVCACLCVCVTYGWCVCG
jgi:hypothetical protein